MKKPVAFNTEEIMAILNSAGNVKGDDFSAAFRVMKEIKRLPEYSLDDKKRPTVQIKDEIFLHLKDSDSLKIWGWIKNLYCDGKVLTPLLLDGLEAISAKLGQKTDYDNIVKELTDEGDEERAEEKADAQTTI